MKSKRVIGLLAAAIVAWSGMGQPVEAAVNLGTITPYSVADVINPMRGQYNNLKEGLFPQLNPAQSSYPNWPGTQDSRHGYTWAQLQPTDPASLAPGATDAQKYDFSAIDADVAVAAARGERFTFRVVAFASCCEASYPANTNMKVPAWLRGLGGATNDYVNAGVTHVIPDWNNATYLTNLEELIAALGRRYNKDERIANFELSGYGDFSENHNTFMRDTLGLPGPDESDSIAQLGYYSQYEDQYITKANLIRVVDANLKAFPDTQIQVTPQNPEIVKQALRDSAEITGLTRPVGLRSDCLAVFEPPQTWAVNQWSWYVENEDPILPIVLNRWRTAPISTEWCTWVPGTEQAYFEQGLRDTVNYHVSQIASTGHPYQFSGSSMPSNLYQLWQSAAKYSGYRYAMTGASMPDTITQGAQLPLSINWTNFGVAPVYDDWQIGYEVRDNHGATVVSTPSSFSLKSLQPSQNYIDTDDEPSTASATDARSLSTDSLAPGEYTVFARVTWNQHKAGGTNTVNFAPMNLAMAGRDGSGGYQVGSFVVAASPSGTSSNPVGSVVSSGAISTPGAPNTGAGKMSGLPIHLIVAIFAACLVIASLAMVAWRRMLR